MQQKTDEKENTQKKINTLNESSLHKTLKLMYALNENSKTEIELDGKIYDIVSNNGDVIEIQTQNLGKLLAKCMVALGKKRKIKIVYPLAVTKYLEMYGAAGERISRRKSPKRKTIYDLFTELTGIYPVLLEKGFSLEVLECVICERRIKTDAPVQSANGRRRFRKNWNKNDKILEEIVSTRVFSKASDYLALLPPALPEEFTASDIRSAIKSDKSLPKSAAANANIMLWVMTRMNLIEHIGNKGRARIYKITAKQNNANA